MIKELNTHYSFTNPASVHDEEALTALELAGRTTAKVNEVVRAQNTLTEQTLEHLENQDADIQNQKDVVIPATIKTEVQNHIDGGEFDKAIDEYAGHLEQRLDNLLGSVDEGSTTMDAEVIDVRTDLDGGVWANAGSSVRAQIKKAYQRNTQANIFVNKPPVIAYSEDKTLSISFTGQTIVFYNSTEYVLGDKTATLENATGSLYQVIFDLENKVFEVKHHASDVPFGWVCVGYIYKNWCQLNLVGSAIDNDIYIDSFNPLNHNVYVDKNPTATWTIVDNIRTITIVFPDIYLMSRVYSYKITARTLICDMVANKSLFKIVYDTAKDEISLIKHDDRLTSGNMLIIGYLHTHYGVRMNGCNPMMNTDQCLTLAPILMGPASQFVEFDSVNKTVKFPTDTLIMMNKDYGSTKYVGLFDETQTTASWSHLSTSAIVVYFDLDTMTLNCCRYDEKLMNNKVAVAIIRTSKGQVACTVPYKWNGKPFNMDYTMLDLEMKPLENYDATVKGIAHRGAPKLAPENTLAAYRVAVSEGFNYVECDVSFTSDNVAVLLHDDTIDRTSNGTGSISEMTFAEVRNYDFGSWFSTDYTGEPIPTFEEFIKLCRELGLHPYIELKAGTQAQIEGLVATVKRYGMINKVSWISFSNILLSYVKGVHESARLGYVKSVLDDTEIANAVGLKNGVNTVFCAGHHSNITDAVVEKLIENDLALEVWTVNSKANVVNAHPYVSGFISDNLHGGKVLYEENK